MRRKEAAEWVIKLADPNVSHSEVLKWEAWIRRNARNSRAFEEMEQTWRRMNKHLGDLKDIPIPSQREQETDRRAAALPFSKRLARWSTAEWDRAWIRLACWSRTTQRATLATCVILCLAVLALLMSRTILEPVTVQSMQSYQTAIAEHRRIALPDGSFILMGAKSSVSVSLSPGERIVMLESGEALFEVADDDKRPFIVMAGVGTITALGTVFNVRRDENRVVITVTEGSVEVKRTPQGAKTGSWTLAPAESRMTATIDAGVQAVISPSELSVLELSDPSKVTEWQAGHLQYRAEPLKYVIAGVSRYSAKEIIIVDAEVEDMLFTGSVLQDQTEDWLQALEAVFPIEVVRAGDNKVLIRIHARPGGD